MQESSNNIIAEVRGNIGIITLNRPDVLNAVSLEMLNDISYQMQTWEYDEEIRVIILRGADNVFAAGIDSSISTTSSIETCSIDSPILTTSSRNISQVIGPACVFTNL